MEVSKGNLLEETHYYPFGLPIVGLGSVDVPQNFKENRHKYQGNEYIKAISLNWMDFQARQYDPQIGRFLGVDPLAASGGQDMFSPYAAMGNAPESTIDPNGEMFQPAKGATSFYAANDKLYRGDEGGSGSGGGGGSGTGGDAIWAALSAFGLEGSANIMEYAAKKQQEAMTGAENNQDQAPVANGEGNENMIIGHPKAQQEENSDITFTEDDIFYNGSSEQEIDKQVSDAWCIPTSLQEISENVEGPFHNVNDILAYAIMTFGLKAGSGLDPKEATMVIIHFFDAKHFQTYEDGIKAGYPAILFRENSDGTGHALVGVGYNQKTGNYIYLDPGTGGPPHVAPPSTFLDTLLIITNNK